MIIDIIWLLFLFLLLVYFMFLRSKAKKASHWHTTEAYITACEWSTEGYNLWPKIQFKYYVDGMEYMSEHLFLDTSHNTPTSRYARRVAYKVAKAHINNEPIKVYYHPDEPEISAIDVKVPSKINFIIFLLSGLILLHLIVLFFRFF